MMQDKVTLVCQGSEKPATSCEEGLDSLPEGGIAGTEFEKGMTQWKVWMMPEGHLFERW